MNNQDNGDFKDYVKNWSEQYRIRMIMVEQDTHDLKIAKALKQLKFRLEIGAKAQ